MSQPNDKFQTPVQVFSWTTVYGPVVPPLAGASAYSAGNCVGGLLSLTGLFRPATIGDWPVNLLSLTVADLDNQKAALDVLLFNAKPTTTFTDQATPTIAAADVPLICGIVAVPSASYVSIGGSSIRAVVTVAPINLMLMAPGLSTLYAAILTTGTPTYTTVKSLTLYWGIQGN